MTDALPGLREYRLTTAEIIYRMPDHPDLLQSFIWQKLDLAPDFPNSAVSWSSGAAASRASSTL